MWKFIKSQIIRFTTASTTEPLITINTRSVAYKKLSGREKLAIANRLHDFLSGQYISVARHNQILKVAKLTGQVLEVPKHTHTHVKSWGQYEILMEGTLESSEVTMTIYRSVDTGKIWIRPSNEFNDGRFEKV